MGGGTGGGTSHSSQAATIAPELQPFFKATGERAEAFQGAAPLAPFISAQPPGVAPFAPLTASPANTTAGAMSLKDKLGMAASAANVAGVGKSFFPGGEPRKGPGPLEPVASGSTDFRPTAMDFAAPIVETTLPYPPGSWPLGPYDPRRRWGGVGGSR